MYCFYNSHIYDIILQLEARGPLMLGFYSLQKWRDKSATTLDVFISKKGPPGPSERQFHIANERPNLVFKRICMHFRERRLYEQITSFLVHF